MIRRILLHNVGVFEHATVPQDLKRFVLIYAKNAGGKTTLAEVLRSLETGDPSIIIKRHKFGARDAQYVAIDCYGYPSKVSFLNRRWEPVRPPVRVFDEVFVDDNVYSGLEVVSRHKRHLHDLTLGKRGVDLSRRRDELSKAINECNRDMRKARNGVPKDQRGHRTMDNFCDIPEMPDLGLQLRRAKTDLEAVQDSDAILKTSEFKKICLPTFDVAAINLILQRGLDNLDAEAAAHVFNHMVSLGEGGESWISWGMKYVSDNNSVCPFCGQDAVGASILEHYRAYFSEAYTRLKDDIKTMLDDVRRTHSVHAQTTFERAVGANRDAGHVWSKYGLQLPEIDTVSVTAAWISALNEIVGVLQAKLAAPLEHKSLDVDVVKSYQRYSGLVEDINRQIDVCNDRIRKKREMVESNTITSVRGRLEWFELVRERYYSAASAWCDLYIRARTEKNEATTEKIKVTRQLEKYRNEVFPMLENGVNRHLGDFGVRFALSGFRPMNTGSGSTCNYNVHVDSTPISTRKSKYYVGPSIGETLSTSDRSTLALAFFLSSLDASENLSKTTVVIDDPVSSFDDNRSLATVQALQKLSKRVKQMILLSHKTSFLNKMWRELDHEECLTLSIVRTGTGFDIRTWAIDQGPNVA